VEIMNYNVNNENERIIIGEVGENLAESCTIDYSAWVEEYGEGDLHIRAIREGDAEPYPVANVETADGVATWTYTAADTAVKGFGEVQVLYYVGDVLAKSRVWKTYTYRSLNTSGEEAPDPYADWLNAVERIGGQVEADAEAASASADSASASATLAAGSASEAAESALSASRSASAALGSASAASSSADSAASSATAASRSATEASNYEYYSEQYMNEAKSAKFGAESARTGAENAKAAAQASATAAAQSAEQAEEAAESIEASADLIQKLMDNQIHDTATGTIATYPDGAEFNAVSLIAEINPVQDTSGGAPSPSHICPISGWDSVDVSVAGKNLLPSDAFSVDGYVKGDGSISAPSATNIEKATDFLEIVSGTAYIFSVKIANSDTKWIGIGIYDADKNFINRVGGTKGTAETTTQALSATDTENAKYVRISLRTFGSTIEDAQLELGSTDTSYEPYQGTTITTTLPQTVYGGTLDVVSGVLTVTHGNIASYNGETLPSTWISDRDVYASGTTPTTGAQVVYELATPQTYQLTPQDVEILKGRNNVWADSGDVTVEYIADTKLYIQKAIS
jgi:hypothetical protein